MSERRFSGVITALVTPFKNGDLDLPSFRRLLRQQLDAGVQGFVINGTTAESPTLKSAEAAQLFKVAQVEVAGQVPLMFGASSNSTDQACENARAACAMGAEALLVVVPYYNRPPQRGLVAHFTKVAEASSVPIYLYNVPSRTGAALDVDTIVRLSQVRGIVGLKEATGDLQLHQQIRQKVSPNFTLLSGDDWTAVDHCAQGGHGVISVSSHVVPQETLHFLARAKVAGEEYRQKLGPLIHQLFMESNPIPVKMALHWMGVIDSPELRLPLMPLSEHYHQELRTCLHALGKI